MEGFPSGQREQTVNLSSMTSVVRIHHLPPNARTYRKRCVLFVLSIGIILNCYGYCAILILLKVLTEPLKTSKNTRKKGKFKGTETTPPRAGITPVPGGVSLYFSIASASLRISCSPYWYRSRYSNVCSSRPAASCTVSMAFCTALQLCKSTPFFHILR